jgi:hypothetical protein
MEEQLPDIVLDGSTPFLFLGGFAILLIMLLSGMAIAAWLRRRARMTGIYRKYATFSERPARRRIRG